MIPVLQLQSETSYLKKQILIIRLSQRHRDTIGKFEWYRFANFFKYFCKNIKSDIYWYRHFTLDY